MMTPAIEAALEGVRQAKAAVETARAGFDLLVEACDRASDRLVQTKHDYEDAWAAVRAAIEAEQ